MTTVNGCRGRPGQSAPSAASADRTAVRTSATAAGATVPPPVVTGYEVGSWTKSSAASEKAGRNTGGLRHRLPARAGEDSAGPAPEFPMKTIWKFLIPVPLALAL